MNERKKERKERERKKERERERERKKERKKERERKKEGKKERKKIKQREREVSRANYEFYCQFQPSLSHCYYFHCYSVLFYEELGTELQILYRINLSYITSNFGIEVIVFIIDLQKKYCLKAAPVAYLC